MQLSRTALSCSLLLALLLALVPDAVSAGAQCALKPPKSWSTGGGDGGGGSSNHTGGDADGDGGTNSTSTGNSTVPDHGDGDGSTSGGGTSTAPCVKDKVATAWYTGWHQSQFPLNQLSWNKYTIVTYAFATTTPDVETLYLSDSDKSILPDFVSTAHKNGVKASLSLGGWGGSQYFSTAVATAQNRTEFVATILELVSTYDLDGIDFDWEYPGRPGAGTNTVSTSDSSSFLLLLQELRANQAAKDLVLSAAVSLSPFAGSDGAPMSNVSAFAQVLDYIEIMVYDITGSWADTPGPNAPLNDTCAQTKTGSAVSAVNAWTTADFPVHKIVLGVGSYGHAFSVSPSSSFAFKSANERASCAAFTSNTGWDGSQGTDPCGNPIPSGGVWNFNALVSGGYLDDQGNAASGIDYRYDDCSQTPYVYGAASETMVSYDNAKSFAAKGDFIKNHGLMGFAMWEAAADYGDILLDSITSAAKC